MSRKKTNKQLAGSLEEQRLSEIFGQRLSLRHKKRMRPRPITTHERVWLIRGLNLLRTGEYVGCHAVDLETGKPPTPGPPVDPQPYLDQLDQLTVIHQCACGQKNCHTVSFQQSQHGAVRPLVMHGTGDGRWLIICVNHTTKELAQLEII